MHELATTVYLGFTSNEFWMDRYLEGGGGGGGGERCKYVSRSHRVGVVFKLTLDEVTLQFWYNCTLTQTGNRLGGYWQQEIRLFGTVLCKTTART